MKIPILALLCGSSIVASGQPLETLQRIQELESKRDPKCFATAVRVEDFMFGTPLSKAAREQKIELQRRLVTELWREASASASAAGETQVEPKHLHDSLARLKKTEADGGWEVELADGQRIQLSARDCRHYFNIAYALRAILSVQQEVLFAEAPPLPLSRSSILELETLLNVQTLAALSLADMAARKANEFEISSARFEAAWNALSSEQVGAGVPLVSGPPEGRMETTRKIVEQKVASFQAYNQLSEQIFLRNIQVYFARHKWSADENESKELRDLFAAAVIAFTKDLWTGSEGIARSKNHPFIRQSDVEEFADRFIPHKMNQYEDIIFFPRLGPEERMMIEAYDLDSFRDSGVHWKYLEFAMNDADFAGKLEPDPFAAEVLTENIAQFGVLLLRQMGIIAKQEDTPTLTVPQVEKALRAIQSKIDAHVEAVPETPVTDQVASTQDSKPFGKEQFFTERTEKVGLKFDHRLSDWLSRLLRSYVKKSDEVGLLEIPPAFGGSGMAAEDMDGDGWPDLLLLSGSGNKLFRNNRKGGFEDITKKSGLTHLREEDKQPGEPRQPLVVDFDNDGIEDVLITYVNEPHRLYRGVGGGRFEEVTAQAGLGGANSVGGPAAAFDFDRDGLLDLYITYFGDYLNGVLPTIRRDNINGLQNRLFRNLGDFRFEDVTEKSGTAGSGWSQAVIHTDFDRDGLEDLIVGNDFGFDNYYKNLGDGRFEEVRKKLQTDKPNYTMGIGTADLNRDSYPEIYISGIVTLNKDEKYVEPNLNTRMKMNPEKLSQMRVVEANDLFMSRVTDGKFGGYFLSKAVKRGESSTGWAWDADFFDFDNDGDDDLYCVNGYNAYNVHNSEHPYFQQRASGPATTVVMPVHQRESNVFFVNHDGALWNESEKSGADLLGNSRSAAYLDFDGDGDLDIALNNFQEPATFYENTAEKSGQNWLKVRLVGDPEQRNNRSAIGARIEVQIGETWLWRHVQSTTGYMSVHPKTQHFGLANRELSVVKVTWPNGTVEEFRGWFPNKTYEVNQLTKTVKEL